FTYHGDNRATIANVPSYRHAAGVTVNVDDIGPVTGDIAWGGNWFFLVQNHGQELELANADRLTDYTWRTMRALERQGSNGGERGLIDHVELFGPPHDAKNHSRNFVMCPGGAYDRSPCGTGTSAKLACLHADGKLKPGDVWRQESIIGSVFEGSVEIEDGQIYPSITGTAFVTAEAKLILDERDPFRLGIRG